MNQICPNAIGFIGIINANDISAPIAELFNIDINEEFQKTLESIVSMI